MKSKPVVALAAVADDVQLAYDYFEDRLAGSGERFFERYFQTIDHVALNPWTFPIKFDDYHRALVRRSNFAFYYLQEDARSVIVTLVDARRDPRLIRNLVRSRRDPS